jgi:hypothetical protein
VVGERRIGKSSLLYHIYQTGRERLGENYRFVYVDLQEAKCHASIKYLFSYIFSELGIEFIPKETISQNLIAFSEEMEKLKSDGKNIVLLFDEFEELIQHKDAFPEDFFDQMRATINKDTIGIITSSMKSLKELSLKGKLSSPFFNVIPQLDLEEFKKEEAEEFIEAERGIPPFNFIERELIKSYDKYCHPIILQIICYWVVEDRNRNYTKKQLREKIKNEAEKYFDKGFVNSLYRQQATFDKIKEKVVTWVDLLVTELIKNRVKK